MGAVGVCTVLLAAYGCCSTGAAWWQPHACNWLTLARGAINGIVASLLLQSSREGSALRLHVCIPEKGSLCIWQLLICGIWRFRHVLDGRILGLCRVFRTGLGRYLPDGGLARRRGRRQYRCRWLRGTVLLGIWRKPMVQLPCILGSVQHRVSGDPLPGCT